MNLSLPLDLLSLSFKQKHSFLHRAHYKNKTRQKITFHSLFICDSHTPRINHCARLNLCPQVARRQRPFVCPAA